MIGRKGGRMLAKKWVTWPVCKDSIRCNPYRLLFCSLLYVYDKRQTRTYSLSKGNAKSARIKIGIELKSVGKSFPLTEKTKHLSCETSTIFMFQRISPSFKRQKKYPLMKWCAPSLQPRHQRINSHILSGKQQKKTSPPSFSCLSWLLSLHQVINLSQIEGNIDLAHTDLPPGYTCYLTLISTCVQFYYSFQRRRQPDSFEEGRDTKFIFHLVSQQPATFRCDLSHVYPDSCGFVSV